MDIVAPGAGRPAARVRERRERGARALRARQTAPASGLSLIKSLCHIVVHYGADRRRWSRMPALRRSRAGDSRRRQARAVGGDRFMPLMFQTRKKPEGSTVDLFEETFGTKDDLRTVLGEANTELWQNFDRGATL